MRERFEKTDLIFYVRAVDTSVENKQKMTAGTLMERQQFIEEELPRLISQLRGSAKCDNCAKDLLRTAHTGIQITNSEPCPREEFTVNVPPCFSTTIWWAIDNPNPVP